MTEFDHKGPDIIRECLNGCSIIGSPADGIESVVGRIVALLDVGSQFVLGEVVRERAFFVTGYVPGGAPEVDPASW